MNRRLSQHLSIVGLLALIIALPLRAVVAQDSTGTTTRVSVSSSGDQAPYQVQYKEDGGTIYKAVQSTISGDTCATVNGSGNLPDVCFLPLTGPDVEVSVLSFSVVEAEEEDQQTSPLVTLGFSGVVRDSSNQTTPITHSTSITPRNRITVSDVETLPPSAGPIAVLTNLTTPVPGCRISTKQYLPIDAPSVPPRGWGPFYTDCTGLNLSFNVNVPGPSGFHSLRYATNST